VKLIIHHKTRTDDGHAVSDLVTEQEWVRFLACYRIKPHASPA